jgi:tRNA nucleotidyltransferase (CCA-adding enzyme)
VISGNECFSLDSLKVNGKDLILIGITNGKDIGYILKQLLDLVVREGIPNSHDALLSKAKEIIMSRGEQ